MSILLFPPLLHNLSHTNSQQKGLGDTVGGATQGIGDTTKGVGNTAKSTTSTVGDTASGGANKASSTAGVDHDAQNPLGL